MMGGDWVTPLFTLIAVFVGGGVTYIASRTLDSERRQKESEDIAIGLYHEVADRAARCLNDFLNPWELYLLGRRGDTLMTAARVSKFRPTDPVVYPLVAAKLGLIERKAIGPALQFYFALDAVRREIDGITTDFAAGGPVTPDRTGLVAKRLKGTFAPALKTLEALNVEGWREIDESATVAYPHVTKSYKALREGLQDKCADSA